jgi:signal transduction histidine kinase
MIQALVDESDPEEPARANPEQLQRVLFNLITNAIRHTPREGTITVGAEARGDLVEVEVGSRQASSGDA